eukprot:gene14477-biopygen3954
MYLNSPFYGESWCFLVGLRNSRFQLDSSREHPLFCYGAYFFGVTTQCSLPHSDLIFSFETSVFLLDTG